MRVYRGRILILFEDSIVLIYRHLSIIISYLHHHRCCSCIALKLRMCCYVVYIYVCICIYIDIYVYLYYIYGVAVLTPVWGSGFDVPRVRNCNIKTTLSTLSTLSTQFNQTNKLKCIALKTIENNRLQLNKLIT